MAPIHNAAGRDNNLAEVQRLVTSGEASVAERDHWGTALHCAAGYGRLPIVQWLVEEGGASVTERTDHGCTALHHAALHGSAVAAAEGRRRYRRHYQLWRHGVELAQAAPPLQAR